MKRTKKLVRKVEKRMRKLPATPALLTYGKLYQALQELHFQGEYRLVKKICKALLGK